MESSALCYQRFGILNGDKCQLSHMLDQRIHMPVLCAIFYGHRILFDKHRVNVTNRNRAAVTEQRFNILHLVCKPQKAAMRKNTLINATLATALTAVSTFSFAAPTVVPNAPELSSRGYVLMDYHTGTVLVERDADKRLNPASLTKLMTAYVAGQEVKSGNISLDDDVVISRNAWAKTSQTLQKCSLKWVPLFLCLIYIVV